MKSQAGFITADFIFAIVLILGMSALMFVLSFTLSVASITQYITFAAARNYTVANVDEATQEARAVAKYDELIHDPVFKPLYANGWYKIQAQPSVGDQTKIIQGFATAAEGVNQFYGVGTTFVAQVLDFQIPFFGSTAPDSDGSGSQFLTYIGSYLGRSPTTDECIKFTAARWSAIRNLPVQGGAAYSTGTSDTGYHPFADNGC